jgi:Tol biopolymer transport system component
VIASAKVVVALIAALGMALVVNSATAGVPEGPRVAFTVDPVESLPEANSLRSANAEGGSVRTLGSALGARRAELVPEFPIAWSPDGSRLAVTGFRAGSIRLFLANTAGGLYQQVPHGAEGIFPAFAPDGVHLAFTVIRAGESEGEMAIGSASDFHGTAIRVVDLSTAGYRMLTPWRRGINFVSGSYSPDGSTLLATRGSGSGHPGIVAIDLATGARSGVLANAADPVYSPDGSRFAFIRSRTTRLRGGETEPTGDLFVAASDGSNVVRLTRTPEDFEYLPSWDPSGERIAFTTFPGETGEGNEIPAWIGQVNADGTCLRALRRSVASNFYGAAWRPGPGREASRIAC